MAQCTYRNAERNLKSTPTNRFNFQIINSLMASGGVHLTWPDCNMYMYYGFFPKYDKNWYTDKPDNFHDTSIRREECTFSCSLVFYVVSWSHSMDNISTHQTGTIIIIIQFKLPQCKFSQKKWKSSSSSSSTGKTSLLSYRSTWLKSILGFNQYSVTSVLPISI